MSVNRQMLQRASRITGVPMWILAGVDRKEGSGTSPAGARGEFQLMPGTAAGLERKYHINTKTTWGNVLGGAYYLAQQYHTFKRWDYALAAYNAGPNAVRDYDGIPPYKETQDYVRAIMGRKPRGSGSPGPGVLSAPAESSPTPEGGAAVAPAFTQQDAAMEGLSALAQGSYDPSVGLSRLLEASKQMEQAQQFQPGKFPAGQTVTPGRTRKSLPSVGGFTYHGQKLTHDTDGLPGYPAVDLFAKPGTPFLAPENGRVVRLSGHGGTSGNVFGWSIYFQGVSGRKYFITHLNRRRLPVGTRVKAGRTLGTVSRWDSGSPHAHVGIHG